MDHIGAFICGIGFLYWAVLNCCGEEEGLPKKYRGHVQTKEWQKKIGAAGGICSLGSWLIWVSAWVGIILYFVGVILLLAGLAAQGILVRKIRKQISKETGRDP